MTTLERAPVGVTRLETTPAVEAAHEILRLAIRTLFPGRIALVSSFGAESAALLHMLARVDPSLPVLFLDTGLHFPQTLDYRDRLVARLGLTDVRTIAPAPAALATHDPDDKLCVHAPDLCCALRKVAPLADALQGFDAWITGRKRYQSGVRQALAHLEPDGHRIKVNPIAAWDAHLIEAYRIEHDLPPHPLVAEGFASIGCYPCTSRVRAGEDPRAGRWRGRAKTECGIHASPEAAAAALGDSLTPSI